MTTQTDNPLPGFISGHLVGTAMKDVVRRAMGYIHENRMKFDAQEKVSYKLSADFVTNVDRGAQEIYRRKLTEWFPCWGIVGEEDGLNIPYKLYDGDMYFTVDPLDGTKAFIRQQSHGIGTMIALVKNDTVIAACVGDIMTGELYYFRPQSEKVHRFASWRDDRAEVLSFRHTPLSERYVLLGDDPRKLSEPIQRITDPVNHVFKDIEIMSGSIGTKMARLWKGEIGACVVTKSRCTPWDWCPVSGISAKLGFVALFNMCGEWGRMALAPTKTGFDLQSDLVIIHQEHVEEFLSSVK